MEKIENSKDKLYLKHLKTQTKKHFSPAIREWTNSVYSYNPNYIRSLASKDKTLTNLMKTYFSMVPVVTNSVKSKRMRDLMKKNTVKQLFLSNPTIKQTSDKVIITAFSADKEKNTYLKKLFLLNRSLKKHNIKTTYLKNLLEANNTNSDNSTKRSLKNTLYGKVLLKSKKNRFRTLKNKKTVYFYRKKIKTLRRKRGFRYSKKKNRLIIFKKVYGSKRRIRLVRKRKYFFRDKYYNIKLNNAIISKFKNEKINLGFHLYFLKWIFNRFHLDFKIRPVYKDIKIFDKVKLRVKTIYIRVSNYYSFTISLMEAIKVKRTKKDRRKHKGSRYKLVKVARRVYENNIKLFNTKPLKTILTILLLDYLKQINKFKDYLLQKRLTKKVESYEKKLVKFFNLSLNKYSGFTSFYEYYSYNKKNFREKVSFTHLNSLLDLNHYKTIKKNFRWIFLSSTLSYGKLYRKFKAAFFGKYLVNFMKKEIYSINILYRLTIINYKFEKFLPGLKVLISKLYNKKLELNLIRLKYLHLNSDIFTKAISIKLTNKKNRLLKVLKKSMKLIKLPKWKINPIVFGNKANKLALTNVNKDLYEKKTINCDMLSNFIINFFNVNLDKFNLKKNTLNNQKANINFDRKPHKNFILSSLKYKWVTGVRLQAAGRLTKRFTAARALNKIKTKGGLKNIIANSDKIENGLIKKLPSINVLRGNLKPNIQYSFVNSKKRIGAFGLKGWVSSN